MDDNLIESKGLENPAVKLRSIEDRIIFDYNIPLTGKFKVVKDSECLVCKNDAICEYIAPFLSSTTPMPTIVEMLYLKFGVMISSEVLDKHRKHIVCEFKTDADIRASALDELATIESDISTQIDENAIIENQIRQLYALNLQSKQMGDLDKALEYSQQLRQWIILKKKANMELSDGNQTFMLGDMIKIDTVENNSDNYERKHRKDIVTDSRIIETKKELSGIARSIKKDYKQ